MTQLLFTTQAVLNAFTEDNALHNWSQNLYKVHALAAAIRAVADQVVPVTPAPNDTFCCPPVATTVWKRLACVRAELLAIATELEAL